MPSLSLGMRVPWNPAHRVRPKLRKNPEPGGSGRFYSGPPREADGPPRPDLTTYRVRVRSGFPGRVFKSKNENDFWYSKTILLHLRSICLTKYIINITLFLKILMSKEFINNLINERL